MERKNLLPGNLKELHFWAQSLKICKSIQWGDPTDLSLLFSPAGNRLCPGGFGMLRLIPGVLLTLPRVQVTPGLIHLHFRFKLGVFRAFIHGQALLTNRWGGTSTMKGLLCWQHWICSEIFWVYSEILWVCSEILSTTLLKIALGY